MQLQQFATDVFFCYSVTPIDYRICREMTVTRPPIPQNEVAMLPRGGCMLLPDAHRHSIEG
jgi:hypothetical protein